MEKSIFKYIYYLIRPLLRIKWIVDIIIGTNREYIIRLINTYPSIINNGFRHIERTIELVQIFNLNKNNSIIDIGAAEGITALKLSLAFPDSDIYAFEPIQKTFSLLSENVSGKSRIKIFNLALGNERTEKVIHLANRITASSIFDIQKKIENDFFAENLEHLGNEKIKIRRLDDEIQENIFVNIIKIDVQGYELEVLKGASSTLGRTFFIVLEMQNHELYLSAPKYFDLDEYLRKSGFELYDIIPSLRENHKLYEWDSIYINTSLFNNR